MGQASGQSSGNMVFIAVDVVSGLAGMEKVDPVGSHGAESRACRRPGQPSLQQTEGLGGRVLGSSNPHPFRSLRKDVLLIYVQNVTGPRKGAGLLLDVFCPAPTRSVRGPSSESVGLPGCGMGSCICIRDTSAWVSQGPRKLPPACDNDPNNL